MLTDRYGPLHGLQLAGENQMVPPEDEADPEEAGELLHVPVVDAGQHQRIRAFGVEAVLDDGLSVRHVLS